MSGNLDVSWIHGVRRGQPGTDPAIQVHGYDDATYILRQSKSLSYEAPFMFLLCGSERALLLDTGATRDAAVFPLRATVDDLLVKHGGGGVGYPVIVAHTHGHGDHVAGDEQFAGRPDTTVVGKDSESVISWFGFSHWPEEVVELDLGGRVLEVTGSPGHHASAITVFDRATGLLLTGATVYPGRLYAFDYPAFLASLDRLVSFARDRPVTHVLGCHIEMSTATGRDYPLGATYQPDEPPLQMTVEKLVEIRDAAAAVADRPGIHRRSGFVIVNGVGPRTAVRLYARAVINKIQRR